MLEWEALLLTKLRHARQCLAVLILLCLHTMQGLVEEGNSTTYKEYCSLPHPGLWSPLLAPCPSAGIGSLPLLRSAPASSSAVIIQKRFLSAALP